MYRKIIINGKVLLSPITGIERFAWEVVKRLNNISTPGLIQILLPCDTSDEIKNKLNKYENLECVYWGKCKNQIIWQQIFIPYYVWKNKGVYCGLANNLPFLIRNGIVVVHDISASKNKDFYSFKTRLKFKLVMGHIVHSNAKIATVSNFSAKEISAYYRYPIEKITVIGSGWNHINDVDEDETIFERFKSLKKNSYYFSLSSLAPNKNFKWIMDTARMNKNCIFAIAGAFKDSIYGNTKYDIPENVLFLGRVTDGEAKSLMKHCELFIFPTLYEGFGLPPMEALACGANAIVSDTPCMHEIYGDVVDYLDPYEPKINLSEHQLKTNKKYVETTLKKYTWEVTAQKLYDVLLGG